MIQQISQALNPIAKDKKIYCKPIVFQISKLGHSDTHRVRQILINLVNNAIKFTDAGGVTISALYNHHTTLLTYEVRDTGKGIEKASQEAIFEERFVKAIQTSSISLEVERA